jgi:hypothetical protein
MAAISVKYRWWLENLFDDTGMYYLQLVIYYTRVIHKVWNVLEFKKNQVQGKYFIMYM